MEATDRDRDYWGPERMSYDDELDAWRERTAQPTRDPGHAVIGGLFGRSWRPVRTPEALIHAQSLVETSREEPLAA
jgi:hypothetical protein